MISNETAAGACLFDMPNAAAHELAGRSAPRLHQTADRPASLRHPASRSAARLDDLARILAAGDPRTWTTLRARHLPGPDGRCIVCRSSRQPAEHWPCKLRGIADHAAELAMAIATPASNERTEAR